MKTNAIFVLAILAIVFVSTNAQQVVSPQAVAIPVLKKPDFSQLTAYLVIRTVDGNTIVVEEGGKLVTVRLTGVDTPETGHPTKPVEYYGKEASQFTRNLLKGEKVYLVIDPQQAKTDRYGRTLGYVYRAPDGLFVNAEIIRQGYGRAYAKFPFEYIEEFEQLERFAKEAEKGVWEPAPASHEPAMPEYVVLNEDVYDIPLKTQVKLNILVSDEISEVGLRNLLQKLYSSTKARSGFKYHSSPTNIYIYAFTSKERAESEQWIAMLAKSYDDAGPSVSINKRQIARLGAKPEEKFGLSEEKRMEIFGELVLIERRALKEADEKFPIEPEKSLQVGQKFRLTKDTPLMPELEPADPIAAIERIRTLPPRTIIKVLTVSTKGSKPWYFVEARSRSKGLIGKGWVNSTALIGQAQVDFKKQIAKQIQLQERLIERYENKLAGKYHLTRKQLEEIGTEGETKDWPVPKWRP